MFFFLLVCNRIRIFSLQQGLKNICTFMKLWLMECQITRFDIHHIAEMVTRKNGYKDLLARIPFFLYNINILFEKRNLSKNYQIIFSFDC